MSTQQIIEELSTLTLTQLRQVDTAIHDLLDRMEAWQQPAAESWEAHGITYQLEHVKCGKIGCRCETGQGHGPYWYAYWSAGGRTRKQYIGKQLRKLEPTTAHQHSIQEETHQ